MIFEKQGIGHPLKILNEDNAQYKAMICECFCVPEKTQPETNNLALSRRAAERQIGRVVGDDKYIGPVTFSNTTIKGAIPVPEALLRQLKKTNKADWHLGLAAPIMREWILFSGRGCFKFIKWLNSQATLNSKTLNILYAVLN